MKARSRSGESHADTQIDQVEKRLGKIVVNEAAKVMPRSDATCGTSQLPFSIAQLVSYPATKQTTVLTRQRPALAALTR